MARVLFCFGLCLFGFAGLYGQQTTNVAGMLFTYSIEERQLVCKLQAPTNGWIGVGFNAQNSIVGSDLLLFNIVGGKPSYTDLFVKSAGNPKKDSELGGVNSIKLLDSKESENKTMVHFSIPMSSDDVYDFKHEIEQPFWLILAYSVADEFEHHSRVRKHIPFKLELTE